jgi:hypothetical protein
VELVAELVAELVVELVELVVLLKLDDAEDFM